MAPLQRARIANFGVAMIPGTLPCRREPRRGFGAARAAVRRVRFTAAVTTLVALAACTSAPPSRFDPEASAKSDGGDTSDGSSPRDASANADASPSSCDRDSDCPNAEHCCVAFSDRATNGPNIVTYASSCASTCVESRSSDSTSVTASGPICHHTTECSSGDYCCLPTGHDAATCISGHAEIVFSSSDLGKCQ